MGQIPDKLKFQVKVSFIDLGNKPIPISKVSDFILKYYTDPGTVFTASREGSILTNCVILKDEIIVTINHEFVTKGVVKCRMEIHSLDSVLPEDPFIFHCPEQRTDIEII